MTANQINSASLASQGTAIESNARATGESRPLPVRPTAARKMTKHARPYLSKPSGATLGTLWCECWTCGYARAIASGCNAETISLERVLESLRKLGWQVAPNFRCDGCVKYGIK